MHTSTLGAEGSMDKKEKKKRNQCKKDSYVPKLQSSGSGAGWGGGVGLRED